MEELIIKKLDHLGRGIAFNNDKIIFVENALPYEKVKVVKTSEHKKYDEGNVVEFIKKSPDRIDSECPYFLKCGGCQLAHMTYASQLKFKQDKVSDILSKYSHIEKVDLKIKPIIASFKTLAYRNKVTFQVQNEIGFYRHNSNCLIPISKCLLITDKMNEILTCLNNNFDLNDFDQLQIKDMGNCQVMLTLYLHSHDQIDKIVNIFKNNVTSLNLYVGNKLYKQIGKGKIIAKLNNFSFLVSNESFFQINLDTTLQLYEKIKAYADLNGHENVLDLYCGTGTIGIYLSKHANQILGVEINRQAILDAFENKKINNISNIDFMVGDTKDVIKNINFKPDVIVVDPPRSGLGANVCNDIKKLNPQKIIYVSCDPMTLARDLSMLKDSYELLEITPIDMFPNTYHVECVSLLTRK